MWIPAQTTVAPLELACNAAGINAPTGANIRAASSGLGGGEGNAGNELVLPGVGDATVHQGAVLGLVGTVVAGEALAGQGHDLFADKLLLYELVAWTS